jgi:hypothetical protein
MTRREKRVMLAIAMLVALLPLLHEVAGLGTGFMFMAPALTLVFPLLAGRYVGEERLLSLARSVPTPRRAPRVPTLPRRGFEPLLARGGRLIGAALAVRPPPAPAPH